MTEQGTGEQSGQYPQPFTGNERGPIGWRQGAGQAGRNALQIAGSDGALNRALLRSVELGIEHQGTLGRVRCRDFSM
jgi:hypothetical protein